MQNTNILMNIILPTSINIRNPASTTPLWFKVSSYDNMSPANLIDLGNVFISEDMFTSSLLSRFVIVNRTSTTNLALSDYTFLIQLQGNLYSADYINGSMVDLVFPNDIKINANTQCYNVSYFSIACVSVNQSLTILLDSIFNYTSVSQRNSTF